MRSVLVVLSWLLVVSVPQVTKADDEFDMSELARLELKHGILSDNEKLDAAAIIPRLIAVEQKVHVVSFSDKLPARLNAAKKIDEQIVKAFKSFPEPKGVDAPELYDFWGRFLQLERELAPKVNESGLLTDRLSALETKLKIKANEKDDFYARAKVAIAKYLEIMSGHYPDPN